MRYSKKNLDNQYKEIAFYIKNNSANLIAKNAIQIFQSLEYSNNTAYNSMISFLSEFPYWGKLDPQQNNYEYFIDKANTVKKNIEKIDWLYHNLKDLKSKTVLLGILKNWLFLDYNLLEKVRDHTAQYFDTNIFKTNSNQTFVDVGAYTGDTVESYITTYGIGYKKIICFEILDSSLKLLKENTKSYHDIFYIKEGCSNKIGRSHIQLNPFSRSSTKIGTGKQSISLTTLDHAIPEKIDFIKMDIEGGELKALTGAQKHIQKEKPHLAIAAYHTNADLYDIPLKIKRLNPQYKIHLRYYGGLYIVPTEFVVLAH